MKKISICFFIFILLFSMAGCNCIKTGTVDTNAVDVDNSLVNIDSSLIIRIEKTGFIPISTDSIKGILQDTGRFEISEVACSDGKDVFCSLDKEEDNCVASVSFKAYDGNSTAMISYNFSQNMLQGETKNSVRWGLDLLFRIFGECLSDDIWNDILSIVSDDEVVDNSDAYCESLANSGIKLVCTDMGNSIRVDIEPYKDLSGNTDASDSSDTVDQTSWNLLLVNPWNAVPEGYTVSLTGFTEDCSIDERICSALQNMFDDARSDSIYPLAVSAYRTNQEQEKLYQEKLDAYISDGYSKKQAITMTEGWVAKPGFSEHETGLAIDINAESGDADEVYSWLANNSYKYGFIVRYPTNKSNITGINYEPWHFRYVGEEVAEYIYKNDLTLEEYIECLQKFHPED